MKRRTSWLWVLGVVFSITLGLVALTTSVQARTKTVEQASMQQPVIEAQLPSVTEDPKPDAPPETETRGASGSDASLCFTCGGNWPIFAGSFAVPSGSRPVERGTRCSGGLVSRSDNRPYLCTNRDNF